MANEGIYCEGIIYTVILQAESSLDSTFFV